MMQNVVGMAQAGPTHDDLPPFAWTKQFDNSPHIGMPYEYNFNWMEMKSKISEMDSSP